MWPSINLNTGLKLLKASSRLWSQKVRKFLFYRLISRVYTYIGNRAIQNNEYLLFS